jgi:cytochrome c oxidase assembly factor CtaG
MDIAPGLGLTGLAAWYGIGVGAAWRRAGAGRGIRRSAVAWFVAALIVLGAALGPPLDEMSESLFAAHMGQHLLLAVAAPPLLVMGAPLTALLWAIPDRDRRRLALAIGRARWIRLGWRTVTAPAVAWALHAAGVWVWHLPRLYRLALESPAAHLGEHATFVGTGVLLWWSIVHPRRNRRTGYAIGILTIFATAMQSGALGALLTLSRRAFYPIHLAGATAAGVTLLEDQQLAGLLMWIVGGFLYLGAMSVLFLCWLEARGRTRALRLLPSTAVVA